MRILSLLLVSIFLISPSSLAQGGKKPPKPKVCNPRAKGAGLAKLQEEAIAGFGDLFLNQQKVKLAFDTYVPGKYIQHNPFAQQGREYAIDVLTRLYAGGTYRNTHQTIFAGEGYGVLHYKSTRVDTNSSVAVLDYFKFEGNCIVEHWDVVQQITGNEPNPIAYF